MHQPPGLMYQRYPIGPHQSRYPLSQFDDGENEDEEDIDEFDEEEEEEEEVEFVKTLPHQQMESNFSSGFYLIVFAFAIAGFFIYQYYVKQIIERFASRNPTKNLRKQDERHHEINLANFKTK